MDRPDDLLRAVSTVLRDRAEERDRKGEWPAEELAALASAGAMRWAVPSKFGGDDLSALDLHLRYEAVAADSLAVALILSQRDSAIGLIDGADASDLRRELLPNLARADTFATVGIAQLTTSRQGGTPALRAEPAGDGGYRLDGYIPWSTGAAESNFLVAGALLPDGRQVLFVLPTDRPGVTVGQPMPLVALSATRTVAVTCDAVRVEARDVLRGPVAQALGARRKSLPLGQTFLALGLCRRGLELIAEHGSGAAEQAGRRLALQLEQLRGEIVALSADDRRADASAAAPAARGRCNDLALRITHVAVTLHKGAALLRGHPAQRLAREAMFLLVWSCPNPVIDSTVNLLSAARA